MIYSARDVPLHRKSAPLISPGAARQEKKGCTQWVELAEESCSHVGKSTRTNEKTGKERLVGRRLRRRFKLYNEKFPLISITSVTRYYRSSRMASSVIQLTIFIFANINHDCSEIWICSAENIGRERAREREKGRNSRD